MFVFKKVSIVSGRFPSFVSSIILVLSHPSLFPWSVFSPPTDPHPGNIFVMEGGRIALIDCGTYTHRDGKAYTHAYICILIYMVIVVCPSG